MANRLRKLSASQWQLLKHLFPLTSSLLLMKRRLDLNQPLSMQSLVLKVDLLRPISLALSKASGSRNINLMSSEWNETKPIAMKRK